MGRRAANGSFTLEQTVRQGDQPARRREWRLRALGPGRCAGTLTDADGPVNAEVTANRLHIFYRMGGRLRAQRWLYLEPGGRVAQNRLIVTKLGIAVATLDETITKLDAPRP